MTWAQLWSARWKIHFTTELEQVSESPLKRVGDESAVPLILCPDLAMARNVCFLIPCVLWTWVLLSSVLLDVSTIPCSASHDNTSGSYPHEAVYLFVLELKTNRNLPVIVFLHETAHSCLAAHQHKACVPPDWWKLSETWLIVRG